MKGHHFFFFVFLTLLHLEVVNATHFTPVFTGNPYNPMSILITSATIDNLNLEPGDEIGVFDGNICVGSTLYESENMIGISVSMTDPTDSKVNGFKLGDQIHFKIWKKGIDFEYVNIHTSFNTSFDTVFHSLGTAFADLKAFSKQEKLNISSNQTFSVQEDAPLNAIVGTITVNFSIDDLKFELLTQDSNCPFYIDSLTGSILLSNPEKLKNDTSQLYKLPIYTYCKKNKELSDTFVCDISIKRNPVRLASLQNDTAYVGKPYKKVIRVINPDNRELFVVPTKIPSWLTLELTNNLEFSFQGTPGVNDVGDSEISFQLSDQVGNIQQSYNVKTIEDVTRSNVNVFNNPTTGPFSVFVNKCQGASLEITIHDFEGVVICHKTINNQEDKSIINFDLSGNAKNIYIIEVKYGTTTISKKLILQ
jgi:hypothetical protein